MLTGFRKDIQGKFSTHVCVTLSFADRGLCVCTVPDMWLTSFVLFITRKSIYCQEFMQVRKKVCLVSACWFPLSPSPFTLLDWGRGNTIENPGKEWVCFLIFESFICSDSFISCKKEKLFLTSCGNNTWFFGFRQRRNLLPILFSYCVGSLLFRTAVHTLV